MEAKFSPIAVGISMALFAVCSFIFCIWFFSSNLFIRYTEYKILFPASAAGLYVGSDIAYNGVQVGVVTKLEIKPEHNNKVVATLDIYSNIEIKTDTVATLNMKGITGLLFVELSSGITQAKRMPPGSLIQYKESVFTTVTESAPILLERLHNLMEKIDKVISQENTEKFREIMVNLNTLTFSLGKLPNQLGTFIDRANLLLDHSNVLMTGFRREKITRGVGNTIEYMESFAHKLDSQGIFGILSGDQRL